MARQLVVEAKARALVADLGQAAFVAIAAYVSSILRIRYGLDYWVAAPIALAAVVLTAALVGLLTLRLRGPFFVLVMLAFAEIVAAHLAATQADGPDYRHAVTPQK
jgi:branched-chain amino acid transport system permease protein